MVGTASGRVSVCFLWLNHGWGDCTLYVVLVGEIPPPVFISALVQRRPVINRAGVVSVSSLHVGHVGCQLATEGCLGFKPVAPTADTMEAGGSHSPVKAALTGLEQMILSETLVVM